MADAFLLAAIGALLLDQLSKHLVLHPGGWGTTLPRRVLRIPPVSHRCFACALLGRPWSLAGLWVAVAVMATILVALGPPQAPVAEAGLGAAVGGAAGNVADTLRRGAVVDFIDLRIWPAFNLADTAIVLGGALTLWAIA